MSKIKEFNTITKHQDMEKFVSSKGLHLKRTTGGHGQWGNEHGTVTISTHDEISSHVRGLIKKELLAMGITICLIGAWLWVACPPIVYDFFFH